MVCVPPPRRDTARCLPVRRSVAPLLPDHPDPSRGTFLFTGPSHGVFPFAGSSRGASSNVATSRCASRAAATPRHRRRLRRAHCRHRDAGRRSQRDEGVEGASHPMHTADAPPPRATRPEDRARRSRSDVDRGTTSPAAVPRRARRRSPRTHRPWRRRHVRRESTPPERTTARRGAAGGSTASIVVQAEAGAREPRGSDHEKACARRRCPRRRRGAGGAGSSTATAEAGRPVGRRKR